MKMNSTSPVAVWTMQWARFARRLRWMTHPITVFVALQCVWVAITVIWVIWFSGQQSTMAELSKRFGNQYFDSSKALAILIVGSVLLGVLLVGTIMLFVFGQRQSIAARQQRTFVSSVTHELKSPLASLQLGFETLQLRQVPEEARERISAMIQGDIDRLRRLVDQILVAGRLDRAAGIFEDEVTGVDVAHEIHEVVAKLGFLDTSLAERVTIECPPGTHLDISASVLNLILVNLIENAVKYSPRKSPILVSVENGSHELFVYVKDQGIGLEPRDVRRVFRMFHRSEAAVKKAIPGTGLGLYIVKSLVTRLGGRIWAESPGKDQGSTFYVSLPMKGANGG